MVRWGAIKEAKMVTLRDMTEHGAHHVKLKAETVMVMVTVMVTVTVTAMVVVVVKVHETAKVVREMSRGTEVIWRHGSGGGSRSAQRGRRRAVTTPNSKTVRY